HLYDVDLGRWDDDEMWLLRMAEDGIAAREEAERLRALCDDDLRRHRVGRDVVDALVAERDAALAALRAVEALCDRADAAQSPDEDGVAWGYWIDNATIRTAIRDALEAR
ncbi:MAG: hypothetical protein ACRCSL_05460, partial [Microbacterium sp.]